MKKSRTITYLRAEWPEKFDLNLTLQQILDRCLQNLPNVDDTQIQLRSGLAEIRHRMTAKDSCCVHIAAWTDREEVSTVPHEKNVVNSDLSSLPPGDNYDFLDGDGMMLVSENHCLFMSSGLHQSSMVQYVRNFFQHSRNNNVNIPEAARDFKLIPIVNREVVDEIMNQGGFKKINLNVGRYMETARDSDKTRPQRIVEKLTNTIWKSLIYKDETLRQIEQAENVHAQLIITLDSRRPGLEHEEFDSIAQDIADEGLNDIEIETKTGKRIKNSELVLKKTVEIEAFAKTVHHNVAWEEMANYFSELRGSGILEE